jgi:hypothetical protein
MSGYKSAATASTRFGQIKKRLGYVEGRTATAAFTATPRKKTVGSGTNANASKVTKTPTKRGKKAKALQVEDEVKEVEQDDDQDDEEEMTEGKVNHEVKEEVSGGHGLSYDDLPDDYEDGQQYFDASDDQI